MTEETKEEEEIEENDYQDLEEEATETEKDSARKEAGAAEQERVEALEEELAEKEETIRDLKDRIRHLKADFENYKKRQSDKTEEKIDKETGNLIMDLVPIYDNLDRAFKSFEKNDDKESFIEGVERIYAQFDEFLEKKEVELIKAEGKQFDPSKHEALMRIESDEYENNEIVEEFERGYRYKEQVLKPSKVKVNINPSSEEGEDDHQTSKAK